MEANEEKNDVLLHTPIFDVCRRPVVTAGFRPVAVKAPDWVTVVVEKAGKFLVETQFRYGVWKNSEEFPCGMVEDGEEPSVAARRELKEETGYDVRQEDLIFLGKYAANPAFMMNHMNYFYVNLDSVRYNLGETEFDEHEKIVSEWKDKIDVIRVFTENPDTSVLMAGCLLLLKKKGII